MHESEAAMRLKTSEPCSFERYVVIVVQIIEAYDFIAAIEQALRSERTYEAGGTRYEQFHKLVVVTRPVRIPQRPVMGNWMAVRT